MPGKQTDVRPGFGSGVWLGSSSHSNNGAGFMIDNRLIKIAFNMSPKQFGRKLGEIFDVWMME